MFSANQSAADDLKKGKGVGGGAAAAVEKQEEPLRMTMEDDRSIG